MKRFAIFIFIVLILSFSECKNNPTTPTTTTTSTTPTTTTTSTTTTTVPSNAVPEITEVLSITLSSDARGKYMSTASFTFKETGGKYGYVVTAFQIIYRDQDGTAIGNPQPWDAVNIALALGNGGRIEAAGTKSNWPVVLFWNPPLTRLTTEWQATVRDDLGVTSILRGTQTANMPPGVAVFMTEFSPGLPLTTNGHFGLQIDVNDAEEKQF